MADEGEDSRALFRGALGELDRGGIPYSQRKRHWDGSDFPPQELDLLLEHGAVRSADAALQRSGFHLLKARGHDCHRFYLAEAGGRWLKIDVKVAGTVPTGRLRRGRRRVPLAVRRLGPVVAVLGPDGAGKGTVIEKLERALPVHVEVVYLGYRRRGRGVLSSRIATRQPSQALELVFVLKGFARLLRLLAPAYGRAWCGSIVICDRHPLEALAIRARRGRSAEALERFLIRRLLPRPDAIVVLDAPGETLFARKGEHSVEVLERWRQAYLRTFGGDDVTVVSTVESLEATAAGASRAVWEALAARRGWSRQRPARSTTSS